MASTNDTISAIRGALSFLPAEIRKHIEKYIPLTHQANQLERLRARLNIRQAPSRLSPSQGDPTIPPKDGSSPFLYRLPPEIRRQIFLSYLLPSKSKSIAPIAYEKRNATFLSRQFSAESATRRARNAAQAYQQNALQGNTYWNMQLAQPAAGPPQAPPQGPPPLPFHGFGQQQVQQNAPWVHVPQAIGHIPQVNNAPAQASINGGPPPTGNPLTWGGNPLFNNNNNNNNNPHPNPPFLGYNAHFNPIPGALPHTASAIHASNPALPSSLQATAPPSVAAQRASQQAGLAEVVKYDDTPEGLIPALLLVNSKLCLELTTILYEEYTFEVHIHDNGVELLGFDRIPTMETWGMEIEKTMGKGIFKQETQFCFQRMKHIEFVYFGCDPKDRLAALRMRESTRKLVDFLRAERDPVTTIRVRFDYEKQEANLEDGIDNAINDDIGNFWCSEEKTRRQNFQMVSWRDTRPSIIHKVPSTILVCSVLKFLRGVANFSFDFPEGTESDKELQDMVKELRDAMSREEVSATEQDELMREDMLMDARRDKELQLAGAGGYYKPRSGFVTGAEIDDDIVEEGYNNLADENEMEEDGLTVPFGVFGGQEDMEEALAQLVAEMDGDGSDDDDSLLAPLLTRGSFSMVTDHDIEQAGTLTQLGLSPMRGRKRRAVVEEDTSIFGSGF